MGLILEDAAIGIRIGDRFVGAAPVFSSQLFDVTGLSKSIDVVHETQKANVAGASGVKKNRYHSDEKSLTLKCVLDTDGVLFAVGGNSPLRKNIEVTFLPNSTLEVERVYTGVCTKWSPSASQGEAQMETIEIDLSADYPPAP